ncbi:MAG: polysaccharide biosynthesis/export family protein [Akkermansia sp.]|nr:polysaccharide biosynthesis/export family protein [Akkermansia sp.]
MKSNISKVLFAFLLAVCALLPAMAQGEYDDSVVEEPRARKGGFIRLEFRDIPAEDKANVDGNYTVSNDDGTVMLPYLSSRVRVVGKTARQLGDMVRQLYIEQKIYSRPIVMVHVGDDDEQRQLMTRRITVTGYVNAKKVVVYRPGITLIQVLLECGDISMHGSRNIQVTRKGVTRTYDYFSAGDRSIKLLPNDQVYVPERGPWEGRPAKLLP